MMWNTPGTEESPAPETSTAATGQTPQPAMATHSHAFARVTGHSRSSRSSADRRAELLQHQLRAQQAAIKAAELRVQMEQQEAEATRLRTQLHLAEADNVSIASSSSVLGVPSVRQALTADALRQHARLTSATSSTRQPHCNVDDDVVRVHGQGAAGEAEVSATAAHESGAGAAVDEAKVSVDGRRAGKENDEAKVSVDSTPRGVATDEAKVSVRAHHPRAEADEAKVSVDSHGEPEQGNDEAKVSVNPSRAPDGSVPRLTPEMTQNDTHKRGRNSGDFSQSLPGNFLNQILRNP